MCPTSSVVAPGDPGATLRDVCKSSRFQGTSPLASVMRALLDRQVLFFGGKGGVGKTTCAAATALAASRLGRRVLLVSTDPAHSTSDIFERRIGAEPMELLPSLHAMEIDAAAESRNYVAG